ncbi:MULTISPECIES: ABC transporter permease [Bacillus]|uniref:ABC transporter permease n=1 Tax=Bacillus TaxID=1386 RepID=UPI0020D26C1D|nr:MULTISPECIES: ABC transporter permease subunit [Bacillus]
MKRLLRNKYFVCSFLFICCLLIMSFLYSWYLKEHIPIPPKMLYGDQEQVVDIPPYPPSWKYPFGVDRQGEDVFWKVIDGAKYTIFIALITSLLRIFLGVIGGVIYAFYLKRFQFIIEGMIRAFRFVPAVMLTILFFVGLPFVENGSSLDVIGKQIVILALVAVPPLISLIGMEVNQFLKNEFVACSRTLGAGDMWLLRRHLFPHLRPKLFLFFMQQTVQVLLLLVHLGTFQILIGGAKEILKSGGTGPAQTISLSLSNEWSGIIGLSYQELMLDQWIIVGPCIGFVLVIFAFNLMSKGIEQVMNERKVYTQVEAVDSNKVNHSKNGTDFEFVNLQ